MKDRRENPMTRAVLLWNLVYGGRVLLVDTSAEEVRRILMEECRETLHPHGFCFRLPETPRGAPP